MMYAKKARSTSMYMDVHVRCQPPQPASGHRSDVYLVADDYYGFTPYTIDSRGVLTRESWSLKKGSVIVLLDADRNPSFRTDDYRELRPVLTAYGVRYIIDNDLDRKYALTRLPR